jgi:alpha-ribazole phosphatase
MYLYLVRHTQPDIAPGICYGQTDIALWPNNHAEFEAVHNKLAHLESARIFTSPLQRCRLLAEKFAHLGRITHDTRLMELDFGDWEMQPWDAIPGGVIEEWAEDHVLRAPPNGESFAALHQRCKAFLTEVSTNLQDENVIVFTHAGAIRAMLSELLSLPLHHAFKLQADYGSISLLKLSAETTTLLKLNH